MKPSLIPAAEALLQCRTENAGWAVAFERYEQEIDQLLTVLSDVMGQFNYQALRHRAVAYYGDLNHLKPKLSFLRRVAVCEADGCGAARQARAGACREAKFGRYLSMEADLAAVADEFDRLRKECYRFLSAMVQLNLI